MDEILKAENLIKEFSNGKHSLRVLNGIDLSIGHGESVAIVGPSGSGKSTLLGILAGLESPSEGRVFFEGADLTQLDEEALSHIWGSRVGFIFQSYHLIPTLTALENVQVPLEIDRHAKAKEESVLWLSRVGLEHRMDHLPANLSGGEQQRVALARAMAPGPSLLFADEPTGNLDSKTGKEMSDLLFSLIKDVGSTLVLVTHEPALAKRAERVLEIQDGRITKDIRHVV